MKKNWFLIILVAMISGAISGNIFSKSSSQEVKSDETAFEHVMKTRTIRCGYAMWPPVAIIKDLATGKVSGIFPEIIEKAAANMNLKVEWTEETGWGSFIESLESRRFDVFCAALWKNAERGQRIGYTVPLAYSAQHLYTRKGDTRFDKDLSILNDPKYTLSMMDGEMSDIIARKDFPKAQIIGIPQLGDVTQLLLSVATGKADAVFLEPSIAKEFADHNPGKIRQVTKTPYSIFPNSFGVRLGETRLLMALDSALTELVNQGEVDRIIEKWEPDRSMFMPVASPYDYVEPQPLK